MLFKVCAISSLKRGRVSNGAVSCHERKCTSGVIVPLHQIIHTPCMCQRLRNNFKTHKRTSTV